MSSAFGDRRLKCMSDSPHDMRLSGSGLQTDVKEGGTRLEGDEVLI